jgi:hypothetical protein
MIHITPGRKDFDNANVFVCEVVDHMMALYISCKVL